jgi:amino acid permease
MTSSAPFRRFAFAFGTTFAVLYVVALAKDLALFTVFPSLGIVLAGTHHSRDVADPAMGFLAPAMYWYGWAATAALGALVVALIAASFAERLARYVWPGWVWVIPVLSMITLRLSHPALVSTLAWFSKSRRPVGRVSRRRNPPFCRR